MVIVKNVDIIDNVMLTYSRAKFMDVLLYCVQLRAHRHLVSKILVQGIMFLCHVLMCPLLEIHQVSHVGDTLVCYE